MHRIWWFRLRSFDAKGDKALLSNTSISFVHFYLRQRDTWSYPRFLKSVIIFLTVSLEISICKMHVIIYKRIKIVAECTLHLILSLVQGLFCCTRVTCMVRTWFGVFRQGFLAPFEGRDADVLDAYNINCFSASVKIRNSIYWVCTRLARIENSMGLHFLWKNLLFYLNSTRW